MFLQTVQRTLNLSVMYLLTACVNGRYGVNCMERCSDHCGVPGICNRETGECQDGCQAGWRKPKCKTSKNSIQKNQHEKEDRAFSDVL